MGEQNWRWRVGFLHGFGEGVFQELAGKIRRITKIQPLPDGRTILIKALPCMAAEDKEPQFDVSMVAGSADIKEEFISELNRSWEGGSIVPVNGTPRIKLQ